jgi:TRAP-type mannitol/chloroaromatic compound transport system permease large subunit
MKPATVCLFFVGLMLVIPTLHAQSADTTRLEQEYSFDAVQHESVPAATPGDDSDFFRYRMIQQRNAPIYAGILALTAIIAHLATLRFLARMNGSASYVVSVTALIYVVFGTILLVVIASTEAQLTAAMGILGAVAGYVFGKTRREGAFENAKKAVSTSKAPSTA